MSVPPVTLTRAPSPDAAAAAAAGQIRSLARDAANAGRRFCLALSGGRTPTGMFRLLADPGHAMRMPWEQTLVAWVDERCVPVSHPESNYGEALRAGLPLDRAAAVLHPALSLPGWPETPETAAAAYERALREAFACRPGAVPVFDAILLGLGDDGHVASLFPGEPGLAARDSLVVAQRPAGRTPRLTLTLPVLNAARACLFLVTGPSKREILRRALCPPEQPELPVHMIRPPHGRIHWIVDDGAFGGGR